MGAWRVWLVVALFAGFAYWQANESRPTHELLRAAPRRGDLAQVLREEARTRFREVRVVSMPVDGRLLPQTLEEGDSISTGDLLAQIQEDRVRARADAVDAETASLRAERRVLADTRDAGARVEAARARVRAADAARSAARRELDAQRAQLQLVDLELERARGLVTPGAVTAAEVDQAVAAQARSAALVKTLEARIRLADAEAAAVRALVTEAETDLGKRPARVEAADARIRSLEAQLVPLQDDVGHINVRSPLGGRLLRILQRSGGFLARGTPLFEIGDPETLEVEADLLSDDASRMGPKTRVGARSAGTQRELPLALRTVSPRAFTKRSSLGVEEQRVHVWFRFAGPRPLLGHGYRLQLRIAQKVVEGAALVPRRALVRTGDGWGIYRDADGKAELIIVEPGIGDEAWVSIPRPLPDDTWILLDVPETLLEGDPVRSAPAQDLAPPEAVPPRPVDRVEVPGSRQLE